MAELTSPAAQMEVDIELPNVNNETFVATATVPPTPPVLANLAKGVAVSSPNLDSTFNVPPPQSKGERSVPQDSIMTEDMSMAVDDRQIVKEEPIESPPRKAAPSVIKNVSKAPSAKKQHEIFK